MNQQSRELILIATFVIVASIIVGLFVWFSNEISRATGSPALAIIVFVLLLSIWITPKGKVK